MTDALVLLPSDPSNPQLKHWSPAGHEDTIQHLKGILVNALMNSKSSLSNDIHEADTNPGSIGHRTAAVSALEHSRIICTFCDFMYIWRSTCVRTSKNCWLIGWLQNCLFCCKCTEASLHKIVSSILWHFCHQLLKA